MKLSSFSSTVKRVASTVFHTKLRSVEVELWSNFLVQEPRIGIGEDVEEKDPRMTYRMYVQINSSLKND